MARERYMDQVRLLVDILPAIAAEEDFALKGGTAINLFYRDLPRLSVDVDLTFLPIRERAQASRLLPVRGGTFAGPYPDMSVARHFARRRW